MEELVLSAWTWGLQSAEKQRGLRGMQTLCSCHILRLVFPSTDHQGSKQQAGYLPWSLRHEVGDAHDDVDAMMKSSCHGQMSVGGKCRKMWSRWHIKENKWHTLWRGCTHWEHDWYVTFYRRSQTEQQKWRRMIRRQLKGSSPEILSGIQDVLNKSNPRCSCLQCSVLGRFTMTLKILWS